MRILHRYILRDMLKALALALAAVAGVVSFGLVLPKLQEYGLGPVVSLMYMVLVMPRAAYLALPLAATLAGSLVYGRLATENELMACRASGIPQWSLFWPTFVLALVAAGITLGLAAWPLPESKYAAKVLGQADVERLLFSQLETTGKIKVKEASFQLTVDRVAGNMLHGPTLKYRGKDGQTYCYAPYGTAEFDRATNRVRLRLVEAVVVDEAHKVPLRGTHVVTLHLPTRLPRDEDELSLWHLMAAQHYPETTDRYLQLDEDDSEETKRVVREKVRAAAMAEMHGRLAMVLGCFGLVLIGAGLGVLFHSGHLLTAFGVALAPWFIAYYVTTLAIKTVERALANPQDQLYLIWTPNLVLGLLGLTLLAYLSWVQGWPGRERVARRLLGLEALSAVAAAFRGRRHRW
ncbi:MAG: LptF/LptG family permease [Planctomycetes bacterium]|nr:LptF/LptG family permease [Planctomycetota bacterium]